jgi:hypothetical protein
LQANFDSFCLFFASPLFPDLNPKRAFFKQNQQYFFFRAWAGKQSFTTFLLIPLPHKKPFQKNFALEISRTILVSHFSILIKTAIFEQNLQFIITRAWEVQK